MIPAMKCSTLFLSLLFFASCTHVTVKPDIIDTSGAAELVLKAYLKYDGNPAYIPRTISDSKESGIEIEYAYKVIYGGTPMQREILAGIMPTTILGLPTGGDDILVVAKLEIRQGQTLIRSYTAEAKAVRPRSIFLGGTDKTEMRRRALLAVKESLESQMIQDHEALSKL